MHWARWLHNALETYRLPKSLRSDHGSGVAVGSRLRPVFRDREELAASADIGESVNEALAQSEYLIVICSPNGVQSRWVNEEIRAFTRLGRRGKIHCLIVGGEPHAARNPRLDSAAECFPPALFEGEVTEPLAADIRPGQDPRGSAKLKIIAGLLGVRYDDLRQREAVRRSQRQAVVAGVLGVALAVMTALTLYAFASRHEAVRQRDIARRKTITAERTVTFVKSLFEVADPSEARGETITAREVLDRGARNIQTDLGKEPSVKAELMTTLGEVYSGLGLYKDGEALVRAGLRLLHVDRSARDRQFVVLGEAQARDGDDGSAVVSFRRVLKQAGGGDDLEAGVRSRALVGLGMALSELNQNAEADKTLSAALHLDLRTLGPRDPMVARDLEELGYNDVRVRHYALARARIERALAIREAAQGETHPKVAEDLSSLGSIAYFQGDPVADERYLLRAMKADAINLGPDHPDAVTTINSYARLLIEGRDFKEAKNLLTHVVAVVLKQRSGDFEDLAYEYDNLGLAERGLRNGEEAERQFTKALRVARMHNHRNTAPIMVDLADVTCDHDPARGLSLLAEAAPIMAKAYPDDPWRMAWLRTIEGRCRLAQGERSAALRLILASHPAIKARWPADSFYRFRADALLAQMRSHRS